MLADPLAPLDQLLDSRGGTFAVPDTWQQGRGAYGGLVAGAMVRALESSAPGRPLRSLTAELVAPLQPGDATLELSVLRAGSAVTASAVRVVQGGEIQAHGVGVLGRERAVELDRVELEPPVLPPWREMPVVAIAPPMGPQFAQYFEYRIASAPPFTGTGTRPEVLAWVRARRPGTRRDAAMLAALVDTVYPALFTVEKVPRPMATIAFTFQPFPHFDGLDPELPFAYRSHAPAVDRGYFVEFRELWGADGRLLALNQQTFVIIK